MSASINLFGEGVHGQRSRIFRTSNGYQFIEPPDVQSSKSENKSGTAGQEFFPFLGNACASTETGGFRSRSGLAAVGKCYSDRR